MQNKVVIIGGGASGLVAGIVAARKGSQVTILDRMNRVGKKILATGNGRCNLTNSLFFKGAYRGQHPRFSKGVLNQFDYKNTLSFFKELGVYPKEENHFIYPSSEQASSVLDVLRIELEHLKVAMVCDCEVGNIEKSNNGFDIYTNSGYYFANSVIVATGGMAAPELGSNGSGFDIAKKFGHSIVDPVPALVQLTAKGNYFKQVAGVRVLSSIQLLDGDQQIAKEQGELQLTNYGVSGYPIFQLSRYAAKMLQENKRPVLRIDFFPLISKEEVYEHLSERFMGGYKILEEALIGMFNKKLVPVLIKESGCSVRMPVSKMKQEDVERLTHTIKNFEVTITGTKSWSSAQATAGGVLTTEINNQTMESQLVKGLYFAGEVMDIDGACGGYNLQWAWSTGYIAGTNASNNE